MHFWHFRFRFGYPVTEMLNNHLVENFIGYKWNNFGQNWYSGYRMPRIYLKARKNAAVCNEGPSQFVSSWTIFLYPRRAFFKRSLIVSTQVSSSRTILLLQQLTIFNIQIFFLAQTDCLKSLWFFVNSAVAFHPILNVSDEAEMCTKKIFFSMLKSKETDIRDRKYFCCKILCLLDCSSWIFGKQQFLFLFCLTANAGELFVKHFQHFEAASQDTAFVRDFFKTQCNIFSGF